MQKLTDPCQSARWTVPKDPGRKGVYQNQENARLIKLLSMTQI